MDLKEEFHREKIFKQVFSGYGNPGVFADLSSSDGKGLDEIRAILRFCMSTHKRAYGKTGEIYFDYIHNPNFNALATTVNDYEFIAIFSGTIFHLYKLFFAFMSDPKVLPTYGNIKDEVISRELINSLASNSPDIYHPKDKTRFIAAQNFALVACILILTHEIGHIVNCHVHLLKNKFSLDVYEELPIDTIALSKDKLFHAFEWEADEYSGICTYLFLKQFGNIIPIVEQLGADYVISVSALMLFLYIHNQTDSEFHSESFTHPSPFDRWIWVTQNLLNHQQCMHFNPKQEDIEKGVEDVLGFWSRHQLMDPTKFDFSESTLQQTKLNFDQVHITLKENINELEALAKERKKNTDEWFASTGRDMVYYRNQAVENLREKLIMNQP